MSRLEAYYKETVVPQLIEKFSYGSVMEVPRISKITLNMGMGEAVNDKKVIGHGVADLTKIAGQKPVVTKARRSVASFKISGFSCNALPSMLMASAWAVAWAVISYALASAKAIRFSTLEAICKVLECQPGDILEYRDEKVLI